MTYQDKVAAVMGGLDSDGADSEEEWAKNILRRIGITKENPNGIPQATPRVIEVKPAAMIHIPKFECPNCVGDNTTARVLAETAEGVSFMISCFDCDATWQTETIKTNPF